MKKAIIRIALCTVLLGVACLVPAAGWLKLLVFAVPYLVIGWDVLYDAVKRIMHFEMFDEKFLMSLATVGAFCIDKYPEAVFVMLFYQLGEMFQDSAVDKSREAIESLMDIRPDYANIEINGEFHRANPDSVEVGNIIAVKPGEKIPIDGIVVSGKSSLDMAALTGESLPRDVEAGDEVISGCVNTSGLIRIKTTKVFGESTVSKILELVENSSEHKAQTENYITKFAKWYTPIVVLSALVLAVVVPSFNGEWSKWLHRGLIFLVVSCPCALVVSVPLSFFGGIGGASKCGILIKGANFLETLAKSETIIFDKTGTITCGRFSVTDIIPIGMTKAELLEWAALAESYSDHPISRSITEAYGKALDKSAVSDVNELTGFGIKANIKGKEVYAGSSKLMNKIGISCDGDGTVVHVAIDKVYAGHIVIADQIKPESAEAIKMLKAESIKKAVMLTGDRLSVAEKVSASVGIDEFHAELLPNEKVKITEEIISKKTVGSSVIFVGDGINDAPSLACADIGISMGSGGTDAAIEASDVVLLDDNIKKIPLAVKIARRTLKIAKQNIILAVAVKFLVLGLSASGYSNLWAAVFSDVGVLIIATVNAMRCLTIPHK